MPRGNHNDSGYQASFSAQHNAYDDATLTARIHGTDSDEYKVARIEADELFEQHRTNYPA